MGNFTFYNRCRPCGDYRAHEIITSLTILKEAFCCENFYDGNDNVLKITSGSLKEILEKENAKNPFPETGVGLHLFSIPPSKKDDSTLRFEIHTGTAPDSIFIDSLTVSIGNSLQETHLQYLVRFIEIFNPFESFIAEASNEKRLDSYMREQKIQVFGRPAIIRWWHFFDSKMVEMLGGIDYCLDAPAYRTEQLNQGILLVLCEGIFEPNDMEKLETQQRVMKYFNL